MMLKKIFVFLSFLLTVFACKTDVKSEKFTIEGYVFGTTYKIIYLDASENYQESLDSLFFLVNKSLSTYIPTSDISKINKGDSTVVVDALFLEVFNKSKKIHKTTDGYFDPTIEPLSQFYGFEKQQAHPNQNIDSILSYVGFSKLDIQAHQILKKDERIQLNFNAIAQGYTVDLMADYLISKGIKDFFVELGGEVYMSGKKANQQKWTVGIEKPEAERVDSFQDKVYLSDFAITTSGSYRKWKINQENGKKISHTINPKTGQNQVKTLVSASIINPNCALADGLSTVLMNFDKTQAEDFLSKHPFPALLIFSEDGKTTVNYYNGFQNFMTP